MDIAFSSIIFILFMIETFFVGLAISSSIKKECNSTFFEDIFFSLCIGLSFNIIILLILGFSSLLKIQYFIVIHCITICFICYMYKSFLFFAKENINKIIITMFLIVCCIFTAIHPAGYWDDTSYHLPTARYYVENGCFLPAYFLRYPFFPQNIDILFCIPGLIFGTDSICFEYFNQMLPSLYIIITIFGILAASKKYTGSYVYGCITSSIMFTLRPIVEYIGFSLIDNGVMLFCFAATYALALYIDSIKDKQYYFVISAVFSGVAIGSKFFGLVVISGLGFIFIINNYKKWKSIIAYIVITLAVGSWWYIRSWYISGDPIHPAGGPIFGFYLWDAQDLAIQMAEQGTHGVPKKITYIFNALNKVNMEFFILALGILPVYKKIPSGLKIIFLSSLLYFCFWFYVTQVDRYITYILPSVLVVLSFLIYICSENISSMIHKCAELKFFEFSICILLAVFVSYKMLDKGIKLYKNKSVISRGQELFLEANKHITSDRNKIIQIGFENLIYFYKGIAFGDIFGVVKYRNLINENNYIIEPLKMIDIMKKHNAFMLIINHNHKIKKEEYCKFFNIVMETKNGIIMQVKEMYL